VGRVYRRCSESTRFARRAGGGCAAHAGWAVSSGAALAAGEGPGEPEGGEAEGGEGGHGDEAEGPRAEAADGEGLLRAAAEVAVVERFSAGDEAVELVEGDDRDGVRDAGGDG